MECITPAYDKLSDYVSDDVGGTETDTAGIRCNQSDIPRLEMARICMYTRIARNRCQIHLLIELLKNDCLISPNPPRVASV